MVDNRHVVVFNSTFVNCSSQLGGALLLKNVDVQIEQATFLRNRASVNGGAIAFDCCTDCGLESYTKCQYSFKNSTCEENTANDAGGCFYTYLYPVEDYQTITYLENYASYGPDFGAFAF